MKAKEFAEDLISRSRSVMEEKGLVELAHIPDADTDEVLVRISVKTVVEVLREMQVAVKKAKTTQSMFGAFREGLTKWKAVVRLVHEAIPNHPVTVNYLGVFIALDKPEAFQTLVDNKVFLGYEFSDSEKKVLADLKQKKLDQDFNARVNWLVGRLMLGGMVR